MRKGKEGRKRKREKKEYVSMMEESEERLKKGN